MPIVDFEDLLKEVCVGNAAALERWHEYTLNKSFSKKQIKQAQEAFDKDPHKGPQDYKIYLKGLWFEHGIGVPKENKGQAILYYRESSNLKNPYAKTALAAIYYETAIAYLNEGKIAEAKTVYRDFIKLLDEAIQLGHAPAMYEKAWMYLHNKIVPEELYEDSEAVKRALGNIPLPGVPVVKELTPENRTMALKLLDDAVKKNNTKAMIYRAHLHELDKESDEAHKLYNKIENEGGSGAYWRGHFYEKEGDYTKAVSMYEQGMAQNNKDSIAARAELYLNGRGNTELNYHKALVLYRIPGVDPSGYHQLEYIDMIRITETLISAVEDTLGQYSPEIKAKSKNILNKIEVVENQFIQKIRTFPAEFITHEAEFKNHLLKEVDKLKDLLWGDLSLYDRFLYVGASIMDLDWYPDSLDTYRAVLSAENAMNQIGIMDPRYPALIKASFDAEPNSYNQAMAGLSASSPNNDSNLEFAESWVSEFNKKPESILSNKTKEIMDDLGVSYFQLCCAVKNPQIIEGLFKNEELMAQVKKEKKFDKLTEVHKELYQKLSQTLGGDELTTPTLGNDEITPQN